MRLIDLSHVTSSGMAVYPGDATVPEIRRLSHHGEESHQSSAFASGCHAGTHIDLPLHFLDGQPSLERFDLNNCFGTALCITAPGPQLDAQLLENVDLDAVEFVVFNTGWARKWGVDGYYRDWPYLSPDLARLLADSCLKGVGLDTPSIDPFAVTASHEILATAGLINIENMANLDALPKGLFKLFVLPLKLDGAEASPVRAAALI